MAHSYYFLVSGLPDLFLEENKSVPPVNAFLGEIEEQLESEDFELVRALTLPIDNRNLVALLEQGDKAGFDNRGRYSRETLAEAVKLPEGLLPEYMQQYIEAHKEGHQPYPGLTPIDQLSWLFYEEMAESQSEFLREWFEFDINLRNVVAGINIRKGLGHIESLATERDRPGVFTVVGSGDVAEAVLKSSAPDFGLAQTYPWVEKVVALGRGSLTDMEKGLDTLRWEMLNELTIFSYCQAETVAAFLQKLLIVDRWMKLEPAVGKEKLNKLVEELMGSFVMPEGF